ILGCLDRPSAGTHLLDGIDAGALDGDARAELRNARIGFVFQSFNLLPRTTARENVALPLIYGDVPLAEHRVRAEAALAAVGVEALAGRTPSQLSGGQQQRAPIPRALVPDPPVVLADEPTGNLDSTTSAEIVALLRDLNQRRHLTIVVVTHEADVAAAMARVVVLRDGHVVEDGAPQAVLAARTSA